jgi:divalent metal cation (Fe/Co/Zn/Cd) transporter
VTRILPNAVQAISGHLSVSVDLEVEGNMPLRAAHDVASGLEEAVREEFGPDVEVDTHIEPLPADVVAGQDAPPTRIAEVTQLRGSLPRILLAR